MDTFEHGRTVEFHYSALENVTVGAHAGAVLVAKIQKNQAKRILLIASASLAKAMDGFAEIKGQVEAIDPAVKLRTFFKVRAHTPREDVLEVIALANEFDADLLVAIGGGSVIDACKVVQLALDQGLNSAEDLLEYAQSSDGHRGAKAGDLSVFREPSKIRQIAIPTTLSGAEFSNNAGVLNTATASKEGYKGIDLCPREIIYDPYLARHTPQWLWLSTAIRSLDHAIEGFCSRDAHPFVQGQFLHAMKLFAQSLPSIVDDADDWEARSINQQAVWLACAGLGTISHGASHGIGYILGSLCGVPHGLTSCVMLPAVLEWNKKNNSAQQASIAEALNQPGTSAGSAVRKLVSSLGLPVTLEAVGVTEQQLPEIAKRAAKHPVVQKNPRLIESSADVEEILQLAR